MGKSGEGAATPKRVLVSIYIGVAAAREVFEGVVSRINERHPWVIEYEFDREKAFAAIMANPDRYDGMIAEEPGDAAAFGALAALGVPVVFTKNVTEGKSSARTISYVRPDDREIGREAFRQLSRLGRFETWVFVPDPHGRRFSRLRGEGFAEAVARRFPGASAVTLPLGGADTVNGAADPAADPAAGLAALPKPLAIFAVNDNMALNVLGLCKVAGIPVPGQAMLLGVDNDTIVCLNARPTLSSLQPDHVALGERAVDELARLMRGGAGRTLTVKISAKEMVTRESTRYLPPAEHLVNEALAFIAANASRALSVADVAAHLRVSRPLLDLRFRQLRGAGVGAAISAARLAEVKRRLAESRASATEIAIDCGFGSVSALSHFFRHADGGSLSRWRNERRERERRRAELRHETNLGEVVSIRLGANPKGARCAFPSATW